MMKAKLKTGLKALVVVLLVVVVLGFMFVPAFLEKSMNVVEPHTPYVISPEAAQLHKSLVVGDWHADSALWQRDLSQHSNRGQVDIPRLQQGNVMLQMFTTVTKSPKGQNYEHNRTDAGDNITNLALIQRWPISTWKSLTARALHQAKKLTEFAENDADNFRIIKSQAELNKFLADRTSNKTLVAGLIGTEGSHALDADINNIRVLFDAGFRMMSLQHFFDNALGGSLHGESQKGLSEFGEDSVRTMQALGIIVDVSHSSENTVKDVLKISTKPLVVSHTGFKGYCDSPRNISDDLMKKIANADGIIAVGFWPGAICGTSPEKVAEALMYGVGLVGANHVSLGSDFDGSVTTAFDASEMAALTQALLEQGASEEQIRRVMGGNMLSFLKSNLPVN